VHHEELLDLEPKMADLLNRLAKQNAVIQYAGKLLAALHLPKNKAQNIYDCLTQSSMILI